ncbi:Hypothetical predicted protein, partial [Paramuricea clavata]
ETYRFHRCIQEENENVSDYGARLRHYASNCDFGQFLNRSLGDQFICGIRNSATRKKLLNEDRTFQDVLKVAIADEVASKETLAFQNNTKPVNESVHAVGRNQIPDKFSNSKNTSNSNNLRPPLRHCLPPRNFHLHACYSCGGTEHSRAQCRFRNVVCSRYKRTGDIARVCKRGNMQNNFVEQKHSSDDVFLEEELFTLHAPIEISENKNTLDSLFQPQLGCYTGDAVVLNESKGAKLHKAPPVPYAIQTRVESALLKLEKDGVIERISSAVSAAPIVTVGKKDGDKVRVCGDFSVTYRDMPKIEYPMPKIEDMHSALRGCQVFSVLDL